MLLAASGDDGRALPDVFGVEALPAGELDLPPGCLKRARAEGEMRRRWPSSPPGTTESQATRPVALSLEAVCGGMAGHVLQTHRDVSL